MVHHLHWSANAGERACDAPCTMHHAVHHTHHAWCGCHIQRTIHRKVYADDPELAAAWHAKYAGEAWHSPDMAIGFAVPAGDLGYSVAVFTVCALVCLGTLILRRAVLGFELGSL